VVIGSWDGEELNYFGSDAWVRQHEAELTRGCWAYVNTDEVTTGGLFFPYASDDLAGLIHAVAEVAIAPDGKTVSEYWSKQDKSQLVQPTGTGSDHEPFLYHENIPSAGYIYAGIFGTWHSAYDNLASLKIFDPGMRYAAAVARVTNLTVLRLADAQLPDVNVADAALGLQRRLNAFANARGDEVRRVQVTQALQPYVTQLVATTRAADDQAQAAVAATDLAGIHDFTVRARYFRAAFFAPSGITSGNWYRSLLYNADDNVAELPTLEATLDPRHGNAELRRLKQTLQKANSVFWMHAG
jgi:Peptidase family M28